MSRAVLRLAAPAEVELAELLERCGASNALAEGRVFVDGKRASAEARTRLAAGAQVEVFAPRPASRMRIVLASEGVVAVNKPPLLPTEPDHSGHDSVLAQLAQELGQPRESLFALSRLDVGVSGVLLVATNEAARRRLLAERERGAIERRYVALASGTPSSPRGLWTEAIGRGGRATAARREVKRDGRAATSRYRCIATAGPVAAGAPPTSLLALAPVTGRTHQLRVHAAAHGAPLLGDRKYGGPQRYTTDTGSVVALGRVLLHAAWVEWGGPATRERASAELPAELGETWIALGGEAEALPRALEREALGDSDQER